MVISDWVFLIVSAIGIFVGAVIAYKSVINGDSSETGGWITFMVVIGMLLGGLIFLVLSLLAIFVPIIFVAIVASAIYVGKMDKNRRDEIRIRKTEEQARQDELYKSYR